MALSYIEVIGLGFPAVQCHAIGDGTVYADIVWEAGAPLPSQATLDEWIASNPNAGVVQEGITKYEFRKLFTLAERVAVDNVQSNTNVPAQYRAMLLTMAKDMELSSEVFLTNPDVAAGVGLLEQLGLVGTGRATRILSNLPPL
jgi:hypothetical protein